MHNSSLVINAARGRLIDLIALYDLVHKKNIYAALDVFDVEPLPTEHPLLSLQNVIATPHIARRQWKIIKTLEFMQHKRLLIFLKVKQLQT